MAKKSIIPFIEVHCPFCDAAHLYKISERYKKEHGAMLIDGHWRVVLECPFKHINKTWVNINTRIFTVKL